MQIIDEAREKSEEGFLLEIRALFLVKIGKHKDED
jgi:hypothetical protein